MHTVGMVVLLLAPPLAAEPLCAGGPLPTPVEVSGVPIVVDSATNEYFVLYVQQQVDGRSLEFPVSVTLGLDGTTVLAENVEALPIERYRVEKYLVTDPADVDRDCIDDITELTDPVGMNPVNSAAAIDDIVDGSLAIPDRATFEVLALRDHIKFLLFNMDTDRLGVAFLNTNTHQHHRDFLHAVGLDAEQWVGRGSISYDPQLLAPDGSPGAYYVALNRGSVPWDRGFLFSEKVYSVLAASMPLLEDDLVLHIPNSVLPFLQPHLAKYRESRIDLVFDQDILPDPTFLGLNTGNGYGRLRVMNGEERPSPRDVAIYDALPNELPRVAGIISTTPQTPLSHVNLRAIQDRVPNAFISGVLDDPDVLSLLDNYVRYEVTDSGWRLRAATVEEVEAHYASSRPPMEQVPQRDLSVTSITPLGHIGFDDWTSFGVKAANVAVLKTLGFPEEAVRDGYAVPFYFYDEFMKANDLYAKIEEMLASEEFQTDFAVQEETLKDLRRAIKDAPVPDWITQALEQMHASFPPGTSLRYRSSTNNEDLPSFNGAGLYDSKTQHPDEEPISKSLKQVYASLWNFRAFTEREFHRIDHMATAMGVLVHPNFSNELANGVAVSFDPIDNREGRYYLNTQIGEDLVTNPDTHSVPEEILVSRDFAGIYIILSTSNRVPSGRLLLSDGQREQLRRHLAVIHDHFARLYAASPTGRFAMEIEFKITSDNILAIKQARPWVFDPGSASGQVVGLDPGQQQGVSVGFFDMAEAGVHEAAVRKMADLGVLKGTGCGNGRLCPQEPLRRWELAVWMVRMFDGAEPARTNISRYADVDHVTWWTPYVERFAELGITAGCDLEPLRFCPDSPVIRQHAATFLVRAFKLAAAAPVGFTDLSANSTINNHINDINALYAAGITAGCSTQPLSFCPDRPVTRAEMATFLVRALQLAAAPS